MPNYQWPPKFNLRYSLRAKNISLRILTESGLEVVLPKNKNPKEALKALENHKRWVLKKLALYEKNLLLAENFQPDLVEQSEQQDGLPNSLNLHEGRLLIKLNRKKAEEEPSATNPSIKKIYEDFQKLRACQSPNFNYEPTSLSQKKKEVQLSFILKLPPSSKAAGFAYLRSFIKSYARLYLHGRLKEMSEHYNLSYKSFRISFAKRRWGSFNSKGSLNLNAKLIYLPLVYCDAVILHELCHSLELNHGEKFWQAFKSYNHTLFKADSLMRNAWGYIPHWVRQL